MPLQSTVIGSFKKPKYLNTLLSDWFTTRQNDHDYILKYNEISKPEHQEETEKLVLKATSEILKLQNELGIDVVTDGEMRRENYVYYFCRQLNGFDFDNLMETACRDGAYTAKLPTIMGPVSPRNKEPWVWREWKIAQDMSEKPVKMTLPGPLTIINTFANEYYKNNEKQLSEILVKAINREVVALSKAGCKYIQIDEPVMVRYPEKALLYGIDHVTECMNDVSKETIKVIHLCCGYPTYLDQEDYKKADPSLYFQLAEKLDKAGFDEISIEDAHRHNELSLFGLFKQSKIILGVVQSASSKIESVEEIMDRIQQVLQYLPRERLIIAPDCGLGFLPDDIMKRKLENMLKVCKSI